MSFKPVWGIIKETFSDWSEDKVPRLSAALAYYTIFSIAPILVIAIAIAGMVFGREAAQGQINQQVSGILGQSAAQAIQDMIARSQDTGSGIVATALGIGALLFGATGLFAELHDSMNTIWEVETKKGSGIWQTLRDRFLSFTMVLGVGFLLLVSLVISAGLAAMGNYFSGLFAGMIIIVHVLNLVISFGVITLLFAMIFKILPEVEIAWHDVWIGAAATSILFVIGKYLIGFYLGRSAVSSSFGAAGALVIVLLWVYYASQILFLGAEFTQVYARHFGSRIVPSPKAVPITEEAWARQGIAHDELKEERKRGPRPGRALWQPKDKQSLGSIGSLIAGIVLGMYYALHRKKQPH